MALDAATLALTARELKAALTEAKIAKIFEPTRDELVLTLRTRTDTYSLLLSARSGSARVCLTEESFENPETPPSFCMLMRKHLTGGKLLDVRMEPGDRIVYFEFQCTNEMGDLVRNILCAELMGRYSNLVLVQNGKIIDALKRVDFEVLFHRHLIIFQIFLQLISNILFNLFCIFSYCINIISSTPKMSISIFIFEIRMPFKYHKCAFSF